MEGTPTHSSTVHDLASARALIAELVQQNEQLRRQLAHLTKYVFGRRSEQGSAVPEQCMLPFASAAGAVAAGGDDEAPPHTAVQSYQRRKHPGRRRSAPGAPARASTAGRECRAQALRRVRSAKARIGADITEELDYVPASFVIREYVRPKYACARCQQGVVQAVAAGTPDREGSTGAGLVGARGHLEIFRSPPAVSTGADFPAPRRGRDRRTLISEWSGAVADLLEPIVRDHARRDSAVALDSMRRHQDRRAAEPRETGMDTSGRIGVSGASGATTSPGRATETGQ